MEQRKSFGPLIIASTDKTQEENKQANTYPHEVFGAGIPPYLRGPYSTMYAKRPWTIRQYTKE